MALGVGLALSYLRGGRSPVGAIGHGLVGVVGFGLLVIALQGPRRGYAMGVGNFGLAASVLFGIALVFGPFIPVLHKRSPRAAGFVIATHATFAITAFVLLLAWASMG